MWVKRPHKDKITFSLAYRTQFFYTSCTKLDLAHAFLFERAQCPLCARSIKINYLRFFDIFLYFFLTELIVFDRAKKYGLIGNVKTFKKMGLFKLNNITKYKILTS